MATAVGSRYLSIAQAAAMTSLSDRTVKRLIADGRLPVSRVGRRVLVAVEDLDRLVRGANQSPFQTSAVPSVPSPVEASRVTP